MEKKAWIILGAGFFVLVGLLGWKALWRPRGQDSLARLEESWELKQRQKTIGALEDEIARLTRELDEKNRQIAELQARLGEPITVSRPPEPRLKSARPAEPRPADRASPGQKAPPDATLYTTVRDTSVFAKPSDSATKLATIPKGITLTAVGSTDGWLEIRSKHGRPRGFVRRDDTTLATSGN